jgi:hypothetical protein
MIGQGQDDPSKVSAQLPVTGLPGQNVSHVNVPIFPEGDPRNQGGPVGLPGDYEVTFTFNRPGYPLVPEKSITSSDNLEGDSHLKITDIFRLEASVDGVKYTFEGKPNSRGFLASLTVHGHAASLKDARDKFYRALAPMLSNCSLRWDVPLVIYQVDVTEIRRGTRQITNRNPFSEVAINGIVGFPITKELMTYGAVYREALTSESTTYQFLCYYRLIESMQARRKRLERDFLKQGKKYVIPVEVYPYTQLEAITWLNAIFPVKPAQWDEMTIQCILVPEARGRKFRVIVEEELKGIRDNIAHTLLQREAEMVLMDDHLSQEKVEKWLPPIKCIARAMLKNDFGAALS